MRFFSAVLLAVSMVVPNVLAAPSPLRTIEKFQGESSGKYIVKFKKGVSKSSWYKKLGIEAHQVADWNLLNGFAGHIDTNTLNTLRSSEDVEFISEDGVMHAFVTQTNAPWGLQRISSSSKLPSGSSTSAATYTYTYDESAGKGVDIYIVDTGINTAHKDFGGRAKWGKSFDGLGSTDDQGHGSHCAGISAGTQYGVAKNANLVAVKVLDSSGSGTVSGIVSGLDWVKDQVASSGRPSVVSLSLGGGASTALDNAVTSLVAAGIHVVVAAGNDNTDAKNTSPARAPNVITVGATDITDARASYSNYGAVVDIFAPGTNVLSAWKGSSTATNIISGTSMATPHIAGLVAYLLGKDGSATPAAIATKIKSLSLKGVLSGVPSGTINDLAHNA